MPPSLQRCVGDWFGESAERRRILQQADELLAIQAAVARLLPGMRLVVAGLREGVLVLETPGAALAARCRQSEPSLRAGLQRDWPGIRVIRFVPQRAAARPAPPPGPPRRIPPAALGGLDALHERLAESPLRDAVARLAARRGR